MKILYYIEPWIEMNWPGFRFGSLSGYLNTEINGLIAQGHDVLLVIGDGLELEAKQKGFDLNKYKYKTIRQKHLRKIYCDYHSASLSWYKNDYTEEQLNTMVTLVHDIVQDFIPDIIMTWESPIPFMKTAYPNALVVYENYGAISRHPFPTTQAIDFFGLFKDSYSAKLKNSIENNETLIPDLTNRQKNNLSNIREKIKKALNFSNPFAHLDLKEKEKKHIALVPLQVSGYYAFDGNVPYRSQFDYLCHILDNVSSDILVVVTEHTSYPSIFTPRTLNYLRKRYENFFWCEELNEVKGASQYLLPFVDLVIGTTSSVLLQAVILDIPIKVVGESHISIFSSPHGLHRAERIINKHKKNSFDHILYHFMTRYWHTQFERVHNGAWLSNYLEQALKKFRSNSLDINFYKDTNIDEERVVNDILNGITVSQPVMTNNSISAKNNNLKLPSININKKNYQQSISNAEWVSFDIFDTLVQRAIRVPKDIFIHVGKEVENITGLNPQSFALLRAETERTVRAKSKHEEITINEIYDEITSYLKLQPKLTQKLINIEVKTEVLYSLPRKSGLELLSYAIKSGKRVFLISDMYLDKGHILEILNKHSIKIPSEDIYVSSEIRLQKHSGNLFNRFLNEQNLKAELGLHIGDNAIGDGKSAEINGIQPLIIPKAYDLIKTNPFYHKEITNKSSFNSSLYSGLLISKLYDDSLTHVNGIACNNKCLLGYSVIGPLLVSFSKWLAKNCKENGIREIYFLSRDGKIFKNAFDKLFSEPDFSTKYLYASRRSINIPSIVTKEQILEVMMAPFHPCKLGYLIQNRLGIDVKEIEAEIIKQFDFDKVVTRQDEDIIRFIDVAESIILNSAKEERIALDSYLKSNITSNNKIAIVDIGYKGSMQRSLKGLLKNEIHGYYMVTMDEIGSLAAKGFLENKVSKAGSSPFWQGVALAEWLTLDGDTSVEKFVIRNGIAIPSFKPNQIHDISRQELTREIHEGAYDFVEDWKEHSGPEDIIDISCVKHHYYSLLATPSLTDIKIFEGTKLEDSYGGRDDRWLVGPLKDQISKEELRSLYKLYSWKGAINMLHNIYIPNNTKELMITSDNISKKRLITIRKMKKLAKSPARFFIDSRLGFFNTIGRKLHQLRTK
ncbi:hypothetical protein [Leclercia sp.]|uniref:HAD family hydrolase n=1 Tax=Leclercia sp. TaxID=1898428 RepID=UPI0028AFF164|nr:hypothetical protein [Leclercia sp.]